MKYTHIVFDIDGTLTDTEYAAIVSLQDMVKCWKGKAYAYDELKFALGITGADALHQLGFADEEIAPAMRDWEIGLRRHNAEIGVFEGTEELIAALRDMGCALGIATSKTRDQFDKDFCRFDISRHFGVCITADDTTAHKPTAGPLLKYMELTGAKREEVLYIGDSAYDSGTAHNAGVDFALAVWGATDQAVPAQHRPAKPLEVLRILGC